MFYELYSLGMPLLVPTETLLPLFFTRSYGYDGDGARQRPGSLTAFQVHVKHIIMYLYEGYINSIRFNIWQYIIYVFKSTLKC